MSAITNYFQVKDANVFKNIVSKLNVELLEKDGRFALKFNTEGERFTDPDQEVMKEEYAKVHEQLVNGEILVYYQKMGAMNFAHVHSNKHTNERARLIGTMNSSLLDEFKLFSVPGSIQRKYVKILEFPDIANIK